MNSFALYLETITSRIEGLAKEGFQDCFDSAVLDGKAFVEETRIDFERWTKLLAQGELTKDDFEWLVKGKKDLAVLEALKQRGLALARLDGFKNSLIEAVVQTAFDLFIG